MVAPILVMMTTSYITEPKLHAKGDDASTCNIKMLWKMRTVTWAAKFGSLWIHVSKNWRPTIKSVSASRSSGNESLAILSYGCQFNAMPQKHQATVTTRLNDATGHVCDHQWNMLSILCTIRKRKRKSRLCHDNNYVCRT